jgi:hypothetical protein
MGITERPFALKIVSHCVSAFKCEAQAKPGRRPATTGVVSRLVM